MIKVAIADDHPLVREGIKKVLENEIDIELIGEAADGDAFLDLLQSTSPDIAVIDITMPGKSGLDLIKYIQEHYPDLPVLVLSIHPPERFAVRVLKAGASGYICKSSISKELVNAVRKIADQERRYITPEVAELLASQMSNQSENGAPLHESLSDREFEVLCMIAAGDDVGAIADKLNLSSHTIHTYRARIKEKMDLSSDVEMTRYALDNGLIN